MRLLWATLFLASIRNTYPSSCVCTTVQCPVVGDNMLVMGNGHADMTYNYIQHGDYVVVSNVKGTITPESLDKGSETTSCTQKYARLLEDDGNQDCDAGHILANRLGGYGNEPLNIFPQDASVNRGVYAQMEGKIYDCMQQANQGHLSWKFSYENSSSTQPFQVEYTAEFDKGCPKMQQLFYN